MAEWGLFFDPFDWFWLTLLFIGIVGLIFERWNWYHERKKRNGRK